jgi:hypothetical protein
MIVGGTSSTGKDLAAYLTRGKNEKAEIWELQSGRDDLAKAIDDWAALANGTNVEKPVYHTWLRPSDTDPLLSREDWNKAFTLVEKELGLEGQPRAVIFHHGEGQGEQGHVHLAHLRIKGGKAISDSWDYVRQENARVKIEKILNLEHVYSPHLDRDEPRRAQSLNKNAIEQGKQLNIDPREVKAKVTELYQSTDSGRDFVAVLESEGYTLARGDRRGYVILDKAEGVYSLVRMVAGVKAPELRETLQDYPLPVLPSVKEARKQVQDRAQRREQEHGLVAAPILGSRSDGIDGGGKPPLKPEEQKASKERQKHQAVKDASKRNEEEHAQKNEQEKSHKKSRGLGLRLNRQK